MEDLLIRIIDAAMAGQWVLAAGAAVMVLVAAVQWGLRVFAKRIPTRALPWISAGVTTLSAVGLALMTAAKIAWWKAALSGLVVGLTASGLWSMLGKHFLRGLVNGKSLESKEKKGEEKEAETNE